MRQVDQPNRNAVIERLRSELIQRALACTDIAPIVDLLGDALVEVGVPAAEIRLTARTLHPSINAVGVHWSAGSAARDEIFLHEDSPNPKWRRSPLLHMIETNTRRMHRPLEDPAVEAEFDVFADFRQAGMTDFLAHLVPFGEATPNRLDNGMILRFLSDAPGGFDTESLTLLDALAPRIAAAVLPGIQTRIAKNLLDAYVGPRSGARVLEGKIRPGDDQEIEAVVMVADLRGFTTASDRLPGATMTALLDRHFEALIPAITERGGEVLAFLGDGVMAAFEISGDPRSRCEAAVDAAIDAHRRIETLRQESPDALALDVALHMGTVRYGNVGGGGRQAFTVIGPAVNIASRIEGLCDVLEHPILASDTVAEVLDGDPRLRALGDHSLRGVARPMTLYGVVG